MQSNHTPRIDLWYWPAILLASVAGTNLGDLHAHYSGLGLWAGLGVLGLLAALAFVAERRDGRAHELWFWLVILLIRTGATNISDGISHAFRPLQLGQWPRAGLALATLGLMALAARRSHWAEPGQRLASDGAFWAAMLAAGVFGTAFGDVFWHWVGQGMASLLLTLAFALALFSYRRGAGGLAAYWLAVALARSAGTALGDFLAESPMLAIGLPLASLISTLAFASMAIVGQKQRRAA